MPKIRKLKFNETAPILKELWSRNNSVADEYFHRHFYRYTETLTRVPFFKGMRVLDAGIFPGHMAITLKRLGAEVCGIDIDPERHGFGKVWEEEGVEVRKCDLAKEHIPFEPNSFDLILFTEVIEHMIENPRTVLEQLRGLLKPGGSLIITTPNAATLKNRIKLVLGKNTYQHNFYTLGDPYQRHYYEYVMNELVNLLKDVGFSIKNKEYLAVYEKALIHSMHRFNTDPGPAGRVLGALYSALARAVPQWRSFLFVHVVRPEV